MKRSYAILGIALVGGVFAWYLIAGRGDPAPLVEATPVERGHVEHIVNVTGHVEPLERLLLSFTQGGWLETMPIVEGDTVLKGELLATLDADVSRAGLLEAEARIAREQALLADILAPARSADITVDQAAVSDAETTLTRAEAGAESSLVSAFTAAEDAIREELDEVYERPGPGKYSFGVRFAYGTKEYVIRADPQEETALTALRYTAEGQLALLRSLAYQHDGDLAARLSSAQSTLKELETFAGRVSVAINEYLSTDSVAQSVYEGLQTSVATARAALSAARADIVAAQTSVANATSALTRAERFLERTLADPSTSRVAAQEAMIGITRAGGQSAAVALTLAELTAPIGGVVSKVLVERGEAVAPYEPVVELISPETFELEAYIPEADVAQVKLGDRATVTFDAFERSLTYEAEVVRIALSETVREGVPTYKTTLVLLSERPGLVLRSGMTADIDISTDAREDTLFVPTRSVLTNERGPYVRIVRGDNIEERPVTTGLRGSEGTTEILSGVNEGEDVVLFIEEE